MEPLQLSKLTKTRGQRLKEAVIEAHTVIEVYGVEAD